MSLFHSVSSSGSAEAKPVVDTYSAQLDELTEKIKSLNSALSNAREKYAIIRNCTFKATIKNIPFEQALEQCPASGCKEKRRQEIKNLISLVKELSQLDPERVVNETAFLEIHPDPFKWICIGLALGMADRTESHYQKWSERIAGELQARCKVMCSDLSPITLDNCAFNVGIEAAVFQTAQPAVPQPSLELNDLAEKIKSLNSALSNTRETYSILRNCLYKAARKQIPFEQALEQYPASGLKKEWRQEIKNLISLVKELAQLDPERVVNETAFLEIHPYPLKWICLGLVFGLVDRTEPYYQKWSDTIAGELQARCKVVCPDLQLTTLDNCALRLENP